ncbi:MAG: tandem-95 repeat protein [Pseudomonadota bacterium]
MTNKGSWFTADSIEGWEAEEGLIEIQNKQNHGVPSDPTIDGLTTGNILELDSAGHGDVDGDGTGANNNVEADATIVQDFTLTEAGNFDLDFSYAARSSVDTSTFAVFVRDADGTILFSQEFSRSEGNLEVAWQQYQQVLMLEAGTYTIGFTSAPYADSDGLGALIDNVSLTDGSNQDHLTNGTFDDTSASQADGVTNKGGWFTADAIDGWRAEDGLIEIHTRRFGGVPKDDSGVPAGFTSGRFLELDSHNHGDVDGDGSGASDKKDADSTVIQRFTVSDDSSYELSFSYAARSRVSTSDFDVSIRDSDGNDVFSQAFTGDLGNLEVAWQRFSQEIDLDAGDYVLAFSSRAYQDKDTVGALIDNVAIVDVGPENTAPVFEDAAFSVPEESGAGTVVGRLAASDVDGDAITFAPLGGDTLGLFAVNPTTGEITLTRAVDDAEVGTYTLTIAAGDGNGGTSSATVTIEVTAINESPFGLALDGLTVTENANGAVVGAVTVSDPDAGDSIAFTVDDDRFEVVGGALRLKAGESLDFETEPTVEVEITATDSGGLSVSERFTLAVGDENEAPTQIGLDNLKVSENADGAVIGAVSASDPDAGDSVTFAVDDSRFEIVGSALRLKAGESLDFEAEPTVTVEITARDAGGLETSQAFEIAVADQNEAPVLADAAFSIVEESEAGSLLGTVTASDPDTDALTYEITDGNTLGLFDIDAATGAITLATQVDDAEVGSYVLTVRASDAALADTATVSIDITEINDAPAAVSLVNAQTALSEDTDTTDRIKVADIVVTDDAVGTNEIFLSGTNADAFEVDGLALFLRAGTPLDFETLSQLDVTVNVDDAGVGTTPDASADFSLVVGNVQEGPELVGNDTSIVTDAGNLTGATGPRAVIDLATLFDDPEGDPLTFNIATLPTGFQLNGSVLEQVDPTTPATVGDETLSVTATDTNSGLSTTVQFDLFVALNNEYPHAFQRDVEGSSVGDVGIFGPLAGDDRRDGAAVVSTGDGADELTFGERAGGGRGQLTVLLGEGDDRATFGDEAAVVTTDTQLFFGGGTVIVDAGGGNNTVTFGDKAAAAFGFTSINFPPQPFFTVDVTSNAGDDRISFGDDAGYNSTIRVSSGAGDDEVTFGARAIDGDGSHLSLSTGVGNDTIAFGERAAGLFFGTFQVDAGDGDDVLTFGNEMAQGGESTIKIRAGLGNDTLSFGETSFSAQSDMLISLGDGADTVSFGTGLGNPGLGTVQIDLGADTDSDPANTADLVRFLGSAVNVRIDNFQDGIDRIDLSQSSVTVVNLADDGQGGTRVTNSDGDALDIILKGIAVSDVYTSDFLLNANQAVNRIPELTPKSFSVMEDETLTFTEADLLAGATDFDGDTLSVSDVRYTGSDGTLTDNGDGTYAFTPAGNFNGNVGLSFSVTDGFATTSANISVSVTPVNDQPVPGSISFTVLEDETLSFTDADLLVGSSDVDQGDTLSIASVTYAGSDGTLTDKGDGTYSFEPAKDFNGEVTLAFEVTDGTVSVPSTFTANVLPQNDAPLPLAKAFSVAEDGTLVFGDADLLAGATDVEGDPLTIESVTYSGDDGILTANGDGTYTFQPTQDFNGDVTLSYTVSDGTAATPGAITVSVTPENDAPVLEQKSFSTSPGSLVLFTDGELLAGADDVDGDDLTVTSVTYSGSDGTLIDTGSGVYTFEPAQSFAGNITLSYEVTDGTEVVASTITVAVSAPPTDVALADVLDTIDENRDTTARIKLADIVVTDDGLGASEIFLSGADADAFEVDGLALFLRAGTELDFETLPQLEVTVNVDEVGVGTTPDASVDFSLTVADVQEGPEFVGNETSIVTDSGTLTGETGARAVIDLATLFDDPEGDTLTFAIPTLPPGFQLNGSVLEQIDPTTTTTVGDETFSVTATDPNSGLSATVQFDLIVALNSEYPQSFRRDVEGSSVGDVGIFGPVAGDDRRDGAAVVSTGDGADELTFGVRAGGGRGQLTVLLGEGDDRATFGDEAAVKTSFSPTAPGGGAVIVDAGAGDNTVAFADKAAAATNFFAESALFTVNVTSEEGNDRISFGDDAGFRGIIRVSSGAGDDEVTFGARAGTDIYANFSLSTGIGNDTITFGDGAANRTALGSFQVDAGDGDDRLTFGNDIAQQAALRVEIEAGSGNDTLSFGERAFAFSLDDEQFIFLGEGADTITFGTGLGEAISFSTTALLLDLGADTDSDPANTADVVRFLGSAENVRIDNFQDGIDLIDLSQSSVTAVTVADDGNGNAVVTNVDGDTLDIVISGVAPSLIDENDFLF